MEHDHRLACRSWSVFQRWAGKGDAELVEQEAPIESLHGDLLVPTGADAAMSGVGETDEEDRLPRRRSGLQSGGELAGVPGIDPQIRSEERRVGKECRARGAADH